MRHSPPRSRSHPLSHSLQNGSSPVLRSVRKLRRFGPSSWSVRELEKLRKNCTRKNSQNTTISKPEGSCISLRFFYWSLFQCKGFNAALVVFVMRIMENVSSSRLVYDRDGEHMILKNCTTGSGLNYKKLATTRATNAHLRYCLLCIRLVASS